MRKQTDLAKVKQTALALLSTEINETPYSLMIVKHPFTDTGVSDIPDGKGGVEMIDLTEDDVRVKWRLYNMLIETVQMNCRHDIAIVHKNLKSSGNYY